MSEYQGQANKGVYETRGASYPDPYLRYENTPATYGDIGAYKSVGALGSVYVTDLHNDGSSSTGIWEFEIQIQINSAWYAIGKISTTTRYTTRRTFDNFTDTSTPAIRSLMGKNAIQAVRLWVTKGWWSAISASWVVINGTIIPDYTYCTAPTNLTLASNNVAPGVTVRLSWSGHAPGANMTISKFEVYRSTSSTTGFVKIADTTNAYLDVVARTGNGESYYYKVKCIASIAGWDSGQSSATGTLTTYWTAPGAPTTVTLGGVEGAFYAYLGTTARLAWSGATNGTNNSINGYRVLRDGVKLADVGASTLYYDVSTHATAGSTYTFTVVALGPNQNSAASAGRTLYNYTHPSAPTAVTLNGVAGTIYVTGGNVRLAWGGASAGTNNAISYYRVLRNGVKYQDVASTATYLDVPSHSTAGSNYYYSVQVLGARSNSGASTARYVYTYSHPSAPSTVTLDNVAGNIYVYRGDNATLRWSGAGAGQQNAITGYRVLQNGVAYTNLNSTTYSQVVPTHSTAGSAYTYTVVTLGTHSNSPASTGRILYNYTHPGAPSAATVTLNGTAGNVYAASGVNVTLAWGDGSEGTNNTITGYRILRDGAKLVDLGPTIRNYQVAAHTTAGSSYIYSVQTIGARSVGSASTGRGVYTYGPPNAPTTVTVGGETSVYVLKGTNTRLAWSAAAAGTNNATTGYRILQDGNTYADVGASVLYRDVPSHSTAGSIYKYSVVTLGTYSNSAPSVERTVYNYENVTAPSSVSLAKAYALAGEFVRLSWSGASAGTNNNITGYQVLRNGVVITEPGSSATYYDVSAHTTDGSNYSFTVRTKGARNTSDDSTARVLYTYSHPTAPTTVSLNATYVKSGNVTLSWGGAANGKFNDITGYRILRNGTTYADVGNVTSYPVPSHTTAGQNYTYSVIALAPRGNSPVSSGVTVYTYSDPTTPGTPALGATILNAGGSTSLTWGASGNGGYNNVLNYEVHRATSAAGTYTLLSTHAANITSIVVEPGSAQGTRYYYKVRSLGQRSNSAFSGVAGPLTTNTQPGAPSILYPVASSTTYSTTIGLNLTAPAEPDGQAQTLWLSINGGGYVDYGSISGQRTLAVVVPAGSVTISARLRDSMGLNGSATSRAFTVAQPAWARAISTGIVIANATISHRTDITELLTQINSARTAYALGAGTLPGTLGAWKDWKAQMEYLQALLAAIYPRAGKTTPTWLAVPSYPTAAIINQLRSELVRA